jgi:hypothetical protein
MFSIAEYQRNQICAKRIYVAIPFALNKQSKKEKKIISGAAGFAIVLKVKQYFIPLKIIQLIKNGKVSICKTFVKFMSLA